MLHERYSESDRPFASAVLQASAVTMFALTHVTLQLLVSEKEKKGHTIVI